METTTHTNSKRGGAFSSLPIEEENNNIEIDGSNHHDGGPRQSFELEPQENELSASFPTPTPTTRQKKRTTSSVHAKIRYIGLANLAMVLTLTCPGTCLYEEHRPTSR